MATETERKFLVKGDYKAASFKAYHIIQGYISSSPSCTVRIRIRDDQGFITIKGKAVPGCISRYEWEKEIPVGEALELLRFAGNCTLEKTRYLVRNSDGRHVWEVDEFCGDNDGLTVAEIELSEENELFDKPEWLGEEVTGDRRYYNSALINNPFKYWK